MGYFGRLHFFFSLQRVLIHILYCSFQNDAVIRRKPQRKLLRNVFYFRSFTVSKKPQFIFLLQKVLIDPESDRGVDSDQDVSTGSPMMRKRTLL